MNSFGYRIGPQYSERRHDSDRAAAVEIVLFAFISAVEVAGGRYVVDLLRQILLHSWAIIMTTRLQPLPMSLAPPLPLSLVFGGPKCGLVGSAQKPVVLTLPNLSTWAAPMIPRSHLPEEHEEPERIDCIGKSR